MSTEQTPRTDTECWRDKNDVGVRVDFARGLERELATERTRADAAEEANRLKEDALRMWVTQTRPLNEQEFQEQNFALLENIATATQCAIDQGEQIRLLKEQIRVADAAFQGLHERNQTTESELAKLQEQFHVAHKATIELAELKERLEVATDELLVISKNDFSTSGARARAVLAQLSEPK